MNFNKHLAIEGQHAFLGASKYHWINYSEEKLIESYSKFQAAREGTELHAFAAQCIRLGQKLPRSQKTLNMYVNDAIGYKMTPEQPLYYSENCFGTADAISFRKNLLRIHDYKSGVTPAHMDSLKSMLLYFVWSINSNQQQLILNCDYIKTMKFYIIIRRLKTWCRLLIRLLHLTS